MVSLLCYTDDKTDVTTGNNYRTHVSGGYLNWRRSRKLTAATALTNGTALERRVVRTSPVKTGMIALMRLGIDESSFPMSLTNSGVRISVKDFRSLGI